MELIYKDISVSLTDEGSGAVLICLHGFLENKRMWDGVKESLLKNNRVITIDLPGHGDTGCLGYIHTMDMMAEVVHAVVNKLELKEVTLLGHSMGGYVALAFTKKYQQLVKGLVLMNSTPFPDSEEKKINRDRAIEAVKQNYKSFVRLAISNLFRPKNRTIFAEEIEKVREEALKTPLQGIVAALEGMKIRENRQDVLKKKGIKKMIILGKHDPVLNASELKENLRSIDIEVVEFADGHMSHIENKVHFIEKITIFLNNM